MKRKRLYLVMALCFVMFSGCDVSSNNMNLETEVAREEKADMTEQQEAIFRSYGLSEEETTKMKEEGMNYKQQSFVDTAVIMLNYLEEKYGETFEVVGGDIPGILADEYWITAQACEGEYAGKEFDVYFRGEAGCTDGYIKFLKEDEAVEALKNLIHEKFSDVYVSAEILGEYGNEITLEMTGEQMLHIVQYSCVLIFTAPDMSEEAFLQRTEEIMTFLDDHDVFSSGHVLCFLEEIGPEMSEAEIINLAETSYGTSNVYKWSEYISTR